MMSNRLADETSPYLLQHADNPVHWQPWDHAALEKAKQTNKPILLSIGYSACHWCHVMAHESFEDEETARLMNDWFVNIKVDREERPDLDKIYQLAHQVLTQRPGGWPLTMFLSPHDQMPFFGGTYFPKSARHGMVSFAEVLRRVHNWYEENAAGIDELTQNLAALFNRISAVPEEPTGDLDNNLLKQGIAQFRQEFDTRHGGFGQQPKFPQAPILAYLLHAASEPHARDMLTHTLDAMARSGLRDHLGGGFFRYCVDSNWTIPHFEKMLYDNAQCLSVYTQAAALFDRPDYLQVAEATARWLITQMRDPAGGFYSSLDADSEGEEGRYYVWAREDVKALISSAEWQLFAPAYGMDHSANFENASWHLHRGSSNEQLAQRFEIAPEQVERQLQSARRKLLAARDKRVLPHLDDKQLTAWNALAISGFARCGRFVENSEYIDVAFGAFDNIKRHAWTGGRLLASIKNGEARFDAYLDDYAYLLQACLELLQARWNSTTLTFSQSLADALLNNFQDPEHGGFYFTAKDHERLIQRPRPLTDDAIPSGNGIAALSLQRLGHLLAEPRYLDAAENALKAAQHSLQQAPHAHPSLLSALAEYFDPPELIIVRGPANELDGWEQTLSRNYHPKRLVFAIPENAKQLPENLRAYQTDGVIKAWVCSGLQCSEPITDRQALVNRLSSVSRS